MEHCRIQRGLGQNTKLFICCLTDKNDQDKGVGDTIERTQGRGTASLPRLGILRHSESSAIMPSVGDSDLTLSFKPKSRLVDIASGN